MEQDIIQAPLRQWLMRKTEQAALRQVSGLPISLASDVGLVRTENQDRAVLLRAQVSPSKSFIVGVLCDGMGGMINGADCAALAVASFLSGCIRHRSLEIKERLFKSVHDANTSVYNEYKGKGGSTLSAFILDSDGHFEAINVGDSRIYLVADNVLQQITIDDTIAGQLKQQQVPSHLNSQLLQHIGMGEGIDPHRLKLPVPTDISKMLLTSDGVHFIEPNTLKALMLQDVNPLDLSERLVNLAKWCGGHDNASVLLLSDLASLLTPVGSVQTGTVQVWDAFSELQLIGIEKSKPSKELQTPTLQDKVKKHHTVSKDKAALNSEIADNKNKQKQKRPKRTNKAKESTISPEHRKEIAPIKPQLRMDFE